MGVTSASAMPLSRRRTRSFGAEGDDHRQCTARTLTVSFVAVFQPIKHAAVLWIEERGRRTIIWQ
jgi:hypothetical protein